MRVERQFIDYLEESLTCTGLSPEERRSAALRILSQVETGQLSPDSTDAFIARSGPDIAAALSRIVGTPVNRVLLAPVPSYALGLIPALLEAGIEVHLADNFKAGQVCGGLVCRTLDEALAPPQRYDAHIIGTIDLGVGDLFRQRLPVATTLALGDIVRCVASRQPGELDELRAEIEACRKPIVFLAGYIDTTLVPTLGALEREGYDVFTITRSVRPAESDYARTDPASLSFGRHIVADYLDMLALLDGLEVPVIVHHAHFLTPRGNLAWSIPSLTYGAALLRLIAGPRIIMLYDVVMTAGRGYDAEATAFTLYRQLLSLADGIVVGSAAEHVLADLLEDGDKVLGFLRYGWTAQSRRPPARQTFHIAVISHFLGERQDPSRATTPLIAALLRQNIHIHYYVRSPEGEKLKTSLDEEARAHLHLHDPIMDQKALVEEITQYDAGWFVVDETMFDDMAAAVTTPMARSLYGKFIATTVGTSMLVYLAAGLPVFINPANSCALDIAAEGAAIPITPETISGFAALVAKTDWPTVRERAADHSRTLTIDAQIGRLTAWLERFDSFQPRAH